MTPADVPADEQIIGADAGPPAPSLLRSGAVMAVGTVVSRITGFARSIVVVAALGSALFADSYTVANSVPNILYFLLLGGALNAVFVPQLVRAMQRDSDGGEAYANRLLTASLTILLAITAAATLAAPLIVDLYSNFSGAQRTLTVTFARFFLPQIFFYGLFALLGQVLNARNRFGPMMWTPILNNVVVVAAFGAYMALFGRARSAEAMTPGATRLLALGTTLGIVMQAFALVPYLRRTGFRWRPRFDWRRVGLGRAGSLAVWVVLLVLVNQIGYWVVTRLSTTVSVMAQKEGIPFGVGYTAYTTAYLFWIIPHGVITVSLLTALMPRMSRAVADRRLEDARSDLSYTLRVSAAAIVPAAFFFLALGPHIATAVFLRGNVSVGDTHSIGYMLMAFGLGLIPFSAQYLLVRSFYALEDTRTPFIISVWIVAVLAALAFLSYLLLPTRWAVTGMAAGYGVAYTVGLVITARKLRARFGDLDGPRVLRTHVRLVVASALGAAAAYGAAYLSARAVDGAFGSSLLAVLLGGFVLLAIFLGVARWMGIEEIEQLLKSLRSKIAPARGAN